MAGKDTALKNIFHIIFFQLLPVAFPLLLHLALFKSKKKEGVSRGKERKREGMI